MQLAEAGVAVVEGPPLLTSRERLSRPGQGKTDPVDAEALARITAPEPNLPPVRLAVEQPSDLRALADYRAQRVPERTAPGQPHPHRAARLGARLPVRDPPADSADVHRRCKGSPRRVNQHAAQLTRRRLIRLAELTGEIQEVAALNTAAVAEVETGLMPARR